MQKTFFHSDHRCTNGCIYCFSDWNATDELALWGKDVYQKDVSIVYPICNSEIIDRDRFIDQLVEYALKCENKVIFSISTKNRWDECAIQKIKKINETYQNNLSVKISVSFSCMSRIDIIEPRAIRYESRLELLKRLVSNGIPTSVMLKPILPFVPYEEYVQLVNDCAKICKFFVVGALYVDRGTEFYRQYIEGKWRTVKQHCSWLDTDLEYVYHERYDDIRKYIKSKAACYESDEAFICDYYGVKL